MVRSKTFRLLIHSTTLTIYAPAISQASDLKAYNGRYPSAYKNATTYNSAQNVTIGKAAATPVIHGKDDELVWQSAPLFEGQTLGKGDAEDYVSSNVDAQLSWKALWSDSALYVILKVKDDVLVWNDLLKGWHGKPPTSTS